MIEQIVSALAAADPPPPIITSLLERHITKMHDLVLNLIYFGRSENQHLSDALFSSYNTLSDQTRKYALLRHEVSRLLLLNGTGEINQAVALESMLAFLRELVDQGDELPEAQGIAIQFDEDIQNGRDSGIFVGPGTQIADERRAAAQHKLAESLRMLRDISPNFYAIVTKYTRCIIVREDDSGGFASEQISDQLGAIRVLNPSLDVVDAYALCETLVHESVHNFLSTFEVVQFPFIRYGNIYDRTVRPMSPWSGRAIQAEPFIHAVFVYFSLFSLAMAAAASQAHAAHNGRFRRLMRAYASGFLVPGRLSQYCCYAADVDMRALLALDNMQKIIVRWNNEVNERHAARS